MQKQSFALMQKSKKKKHFILVFVPFIYKECSF